MDEMNGTPWSSVEDSKKQEDIYAKMQKHIKEARDLDRIIKSQFNFTDPPSAERIEDKMYKDVLVTNALENNRLARMAGTDQDEESTLLFHMRTILGHQQAMRSSIDQIQGIVEDLHRSMLHLKENVDKKDTDK